MGSDAECFMLVCISVAVLLLILLVEYFMNAIFLFYYRGLLNQDVSVYCECSAWWYAWWLVPALAAEPALGATRPGRRATHLFTRIKMCGQFETLLWSRMLCGQSVAERHRIKG